MAGKKAGRIAVQLYTVREHMKTTDDVVKTAKRVRGIGYKRVEGGGDDPRLFRKIMDDAGLAIVSCGFGIEKILAMDKEVFETPRIYGCDHVMIPWMDAKALPTPEHWKERARQFSEAGKKFAKEGLVLQYHNHCFEFQHYGAKDGAGGKSGLEILFEASDPKYLKAQLDVHWVARGGGDPAAWCERMKGRLHQVHMKDMAILDNQPIWAEVGEGNLDWPAILKACKAAGVTDYIVEQDQCPITKDPFRSIEISFNNLRAMGLEA